MDLQKEILPQDLNLYNASNRVTYGVLMQCGDTVFVEACDSGIVAVCRNQKQWEKIKERRQLIKTISYNQLTLFTHNNHKP